MTTVSRREILFSGSTAVATSVLSACASTQTNRAKTHFVLVHGAWHAGWCWNKVVPLLRSRGHAVTAVDLPGRWLPPAQMAQIRPEDYVEAVGQAIETSDRQVVLVGHSLGGATVSLAAEKYAAQIRRSIYLAAFLVPHGKTVGAIAATDRGSRLGDAIRRDTATGASTIIPASARDVFYADCTEDDVRIATQLLSAEPPAMGRAVMKLSAQSFGRVDRVYIECLQDRAISIAMQRAMQAALPCSDIVTLDTSHSPFISRPKEVAEILSRFA